MARKDNQQDKPISDRCSYHFGERRCRFPWSISPSTKGRWGYCRFHFDCEDPSYGLEMIEASERWLINMKAGKAVPQTLSDFYGRQLPGYGGKSA